MILTKIIATPKLQIRRFQPPQSGLMIVLQEKALEYLQTIFTARCYAERGYGIACRLSVCNDQVP